jgi:hypothetical protein
MSDDGKHDLAPATPAPDTAERDYADAPARAEPAQIFPMLIELNGGYVGVVWVRASRSELATGTVFRAQNRRWVITGLSPSGVTFRCREIRDR